MQGNVFGSLMCSKTVDTLGKECLESKKHTSLYKGEVEAPPLAMIDKTVRIKKLAIKQHH